MCKGSRNWELFEKIFGPNRIPPEKTPTDLFVIFFAELFGTAIMIFIGCLGCTLMHIDVTEQRLMYPILYAHNDPIRGKNIYQDLTSRMRQLGLRDYDAYDALEDELLAIIQRHFGRKLDPETLDKILRKAYPYDTKLSRLKSFKNKHLEGKDVEELDLDFFDDPETRNITKNESVTQPSVKTDEFGNELPDVSTEEVPIINPFAIKARYKGHDSEEEAQETQLTDKGRFARIEQVYRNEKFPEITRKVIQRPKRSPNSPEQPKDYLSQLTEFGRRVVRQNPENQQISSQDVSSSALPKMLTNEEKIESPEEKSEGARDIYGPVWHTYTFEVSPIVGLSFGLGVMIATQIFAHISLGHFNPAVSFAAWILCHIKLSYLLVYWFAQICGSMLAGGLMYGLSSKKQYSATWCVTRLIGVTATQGIFMEMILTCILTFVYAAACDRKHAGELETWSIRLGFTYGGLMTAGCLFTSPGLNPARTFGPSIMHDDFHHHWVYWCGPLFGAAFGSLFYRLVYRDRIESLTDWELFWDYLQGNSRNPHY